MNAARADGTGSPVNIVTHASNLNTIVSLWLQIGIGVKTAKLLNLPTSPGMESGTIFRVPRGDGTSDLRVRD